MTLKTSVAPQVKLQDIAQIEIKQHYDTISHIKREEGTGLIIMKNRVKMQLPSEKRLIKS